MKTAIHTAAVILIMAGLAACATSPTPDQLRAQGHDPLTTSQLERLHEGGATQHWDTGENSGTSEYMADGSAKLTTGSFETEGSWRIGDDRLCTTYEDINGGEERCFIVFQVDDGYRLFDGNELVSRAAYE